MSTRKKEIADVKETARDAVKSLESLKNPVNAAGMAHFGINT